MSKLLVAVKSCHRDLELGFHDAIRSTWGREFGSDVIVRFFVGKNESTRKAYTYKSDEVQLNCRDDYDGLPHKTRAICFWMMSRMVDFAYLCDNDTIVKPKELEALPFEMFDYSGYFRNGDAEIGQRICYEDHMGKYPDSFTWASGGYGYFLSKNAAFEVSDIYPKVWAEDMYVGQCIGPFIEKGEFLAGALDIRNKAAWHFKKSQKFPQFTPELLYRIHKDGSPEKVYAEAVS